MFVDCTILKTPPYQLGVVPVGSFLSPTSSGRQSGGVLYSEKDEDQGLVSRSEVKENKLLFRLVGRFDFSTDDHLSTVCCLSLINPRNDGTKGCRD